MLVQIMRYAAEYGAAIAFLLVYVGFVWRWSIKGLRYPDDASGRQDRAFRLKMINEHGSLALYRLMVKKLITLVDNQIRSRSGRWATPISGLPRALIAPRFAGTNPWDESCYSFCLSLAFIYPVFVIIIPWSLGASGVFVGHQLLPNDILPGIRFLVVLLICSSVISGWLYATVQTVYKKMIVLTLWAVQLILSVLLAFKIGFPLVLIIGIASNSILAAVHSGLLSTLTVFFVMLGFGLLALVLGESANAMLLITAGFFFSGLNVFWDWFRAKQKNRAHPSVGWIVLWNCTWVLLVFTALYVVAVYPQHATEQTLLNIRTLLCVFVLLPLFNAPFDWLSLGLTRGLLIKIREGEHNTSALLYGLLDLAIAGLFWLATLLSTITIFTLVNKVTGVASFNVAGLLSTLGQNPWGTDIMWLHLMAATTLLPTCVHFLVASFSVVNALSHIVRNKLIEKLLTNWPADQEVKDDRLYVAATLITVNASIAVFIPVALIASFEEIKWAVGVFVKNSAQAIYVLIM